MKTTETAWVSDKLEEDGHIVSLVDSHIEHVHLAIIASYMLITSSL